METLARNLQSASDMAPLAVDVREAARLTSLSPFTIRVMARTGRLRVVRVGRRLLIPMESLRALAQARESQ